MIKESTYTTPEKEPGSFQLIFTLGLAGFFAGLLLVSAHLYTGPLIKANKAEALEKAIFEVLPGCRNFEGIALINGELKLSTDTNPAEIYVGYDSLGGMIGFAIPAAEPGFQDIIGIIYGYNFSDGRIIGFQVLESKETPGLGDKIFKDDDFKNNFNNLLVEPTIEWVKKGERSSANQVEIITGATISSKAVINMLNNSIERWKEPLRNYRIKKIERETK